MPVKPKSKVKPKKTAKPDAINLSPKNDLVHLSQNIISNVGVGIYIIQGRNFVYVSPLFQKLTGYSYKDLAGTNPLDYIHPADRKMVKINAIKSLKGGNRSYEYRFIKKNSEEMWILEMISSITYKGARATLGSFMDITDYKQMAETIRNSEEKYRTILENIEDGYAEIDLRGNFIFGNEALFKIHGYSKKELMKMSYRDLMDKENAQKVFAKYNKVFITGKSEKEVQYEIIQKSGSKKYIETSVTPIKNAAGQVVAFRGIVLDRTEHIQAESQREAALEALRQSEERYRTILEITQEGYFENDLAGNFTFVNDSIPKIWGYTREELMGMNYKKYTDKETTKKLYEAYSKLYKTGEPIKAFEEEIIRKDGTKAYAEVSTILIRNSKGEPIGFRGMTRDITERKLAESQREDALEALRQSEEKYRTIIETIKDGYFETDLAGHFTFFNEALCEIHGYPKEELIGMDNRQYADKENSKKVFEAFQAIYKTGKAGSVFDYEIIRKDETKRQVEVSASLKKDSSGNTTGFKGITRDVTERKQAEEALRQSEERYRTILEEMEDAYFEVDLAGNFTFVNEADCRHTGYSREELIGTSFRCQIAKEDIERVYNTFSNIYKTGKPEKISSYKLTRKDGTTGFAEMTGFPLKNEKGEIIGFRGVGRDITQRRQMEEALRQSEERYRTILDETEEAYYELDLAGNFIFMNDATCHHLGYSKEELLGVNFRNHVIKEDVEKTYNYFTNIYKTGKPERGMTYRVICKDGTVKIIENTGFPLRNQQEEIIGFRGIAYNVTERKQMEEALRQSEERYRTILDEMDNAYFEVDLAGNFTFVNDADCRILGYSREELIGASFRGLQAKEDIETVRNAYNKIYRTGKPERGIFYKIMRKDGTTAFAETAGFPLRNQKGEIIGFRGVGRDITQRRQMEETLRQSEERYRTIIEQIEDGYFECDLNGNFTFVNDAECRNAGYSREELIGRSYKNFGDENNAQELNKLFAEIYETGKPVHAYDLALIKKDGTKSFNEISVTLIRNAEGEPTGFRGVARDVTERKHAEERIQYLATHDGLTGLPNRLMFSQLLNHAIQAAQRYKRQFSIFFIDLDRFKIINDTLGHEAGDQLLQEIAVRFKQALRAVDIVARLGGDEFVILIEEVSDLDNIATVARKILATAIKPITLLGEECRVTASIGISTYPKDGEDEQTLLKNADIAMYFAKEEGKNNFQFFSKDIKPQSIERLSMETNLRFALERNELSLHYQAKLDFKTNAITGVEALLRWDNPALGSVTPTQFIPVAEESGLIVSIGRWVLRTACAQNVAWQKQGLPPVCMAVNLSLRQLLDENLIEDIKAALNDSGMAPNLLELEITESMVMHSPTRMIGVLAKIKNLGVRLAIDDFGTGYSSLAQIKHFPIDTLKVDRSFIRNVPQDIEDKAITEAIIAMGKTLSLTVVAEGVETQEQMDFLKDRSCDEMQGFYFSKPIMPDRFADLLRTHVPSPQKKI